jgi:hypothetical protein
VPFDRIAEEDYGVLLDAYYYLHFADELRILNKVTDFYRRNPSLKGAIQPHALRVLHSRDPEVRKKLFGSTPLSQIELPPVREPPIESRHPDDQEVIEYLRHHSFNLEPRLQFLTEQMERTKRALDQVSCPWCGTGRLRLLSGDAAAT